MSQKNKSVCDGCGKEVTMVVQSPGWIRLEAPFGPHGIRMIQVLANTTLREVVNVPHSLDFCGRDCMLMWLDDKLSGVADNG